MTLGEIKNKCLDLLITDFSPGKMTRIDTALRFLQQIDYTALFQNWETNKFPTRKSSFSLSYPKLLPAVTKLIIKGWDKNPYNEDLHIAALSAYPILDISLKLISPNHFEFSGNHGMVLKNDIKLQAGLKKKGECISNIADIFELYLSNYNTPLAKDFRQINDKWMTVSQGSSDLYKLLYAYRNVALHCCEINEGAALVPVLLTLLIHAHENG